jgi:hypothetical protein
MVSSKIGAVNEPGLRFGDLTRSTAVPNKDGADFRPVLESGHTIAVVQGASPAQVRASNL